MPLCVMYLPNLQCPVAILVAILVQCTASLWLP